MKTKRFSDALKGALIKMSSDPVEVASILRQIDDLYTKFDVPENLRATLVKPYLNDKAKLVVARLDPSLADDCKLLKEAILREVSNESTCVPPWVLVFGFLRVALWLSSKSHGVMSSTYLQIWARRLMLI